MKRYVRASSYGESEYTDMIKELLGWKYRQPLYIREDTYGKCSKCNFAIYDPMYKIREDKAKQYKELLKSKLGAKYITPWLAGGVIYFYVSKDDIQRKYDDLKEQERQANS